MSTAQLVWFKSSYSSAQGDDCVEVAVVERAVWCKSSYSGSQGDDCVEVAVAERGVCVRDSKDVSRPHFAVGRDRWAEFMAFVATV